MVQKTLNDYWPQLLKEFPNLSLHDIKTICTTGWRNFFTVNYRGADTWFQLRKFFLYCGHYIQDSLKYFNYYKKKLATKIRIYYSKNNVEWDGYYYFALGAKRLHEYEDLVCKRGRPKRHFVFKDIYAYKWYDMCRVAESHAVAIFRYPKITAPKVKYHYDKLVVDDVKLVFMLKPLTMRLILPENYKYKF